MSLNTEEASGERNKLNIKNLSGKPMMIECLELEWRKGFWPFQEIEEIFIEDNFFFENIVVNSHNNKILKFEDENYFNTDKFWKEGMDLYIKLYIAGKDSPKLVKADL